MSEVNNNSLFGAMTEDDQELLELQRKKIAEAEKIATTVRLPSSECLKLHVDACQRANHRIESDSKSFRSGPEWVCRTCHIRWVI